MPSTGLYRCKLTTSAGDAKGEAPMSAELLTKILADYAQTRAKP
jgi:hypothetical protein